ncbi:hypothetical protein C1H46_042363 [Malus baccata]|uniref:Uncharacterized protein n=1 Tax=Malus baccata TaxID=106549 RepID=A0A540KCY5_MALBA|nr:hypothetical protein C1H46_042363 [Malus baccata]
MLRTQMTNPKTDEDRQREWLSRFQEDWRSRIVIERWNFATYQLRYLFYKKKVMVKRDR